MEDHMEVIVHTEEGTGDTGVHGGEDRGVGLGGGVILIGLGIVLLCIGVGD